MLVTVLLLAAGSLQPAPVPPLNPMAASAMRCATVSVLMGPKDAGAMTLGARAGYFLIAAAHADPAGKGVMERVKDLSQEMSADLVPEAGRAGVYAGCRRDYPQAFRAAITGGLPTDPFVRDTMCLGALGVQTGAAQEYAKGSGDTSYAAKYKQTIERISTRLTDAVVQKHGFKGNDAYQRYMGDQLYAMLSLGNAETVADACVKASG